MKWSVLFLFCFLSVHMLSAQDQMRIDSLKVKLSNSTEDTSKVNILLEIASVYNRTDFIKGLNYAKEALEISGNIENKKFLVRSHGAVGYCLLFLGNYDEAVSNFLQSLKISRNYNYKSEELISLTNLGVIQDRIEKFDNALKYYFEALNIFNECKEKNIPLPETIRIQTLYNNIGNIYMSKNDLTTAEKYYQTGLALSEQIEDNINKGILCNNLGKLYIQRKDYKKAYTFLIKSIDAREKINDKSGIAKTYIVLSDYYQKLNKNNEALEYSKKALAVGTEIKEQTTIKTAAMFMYQTYKKMGQFEKGMKYLELYKQVSDSLINDSKIEAITKLQLQYEYDILEKEREAKQQVVKYTYITILSTLVLGMVILGLLFFLARSRSKRIKLEKEKLEKDMAIKNKELTTNVLYLLKKNELIDNITSRLMKLKGENSGQLQQIIADLQSITENEVWEEFEYRFQSVHEEFYQNLKREFPELSPSEIKLAAFLRLNMTTKDIASITGLSIPGLETARHRLRKKLGIANQDVNLVNFLLKY